MKATITNLRALNKILESKGIDIALHETARKNGKGYQGNTPFRAWGKTVGTAREIMDSMIDTFNILQIEIPAGL